MKRIAFVLTFAAFFASLVAFSVFFPAAPASAIIGGQVDDENKYPYVGSVDARPAGRGFASGVLVSPTVYVTAGHVTRFFDDANLTRARVTFDPVAPESSTFFEGTVHTHPDFTGGPGDRNDLGVVVFDAPIPGITPAELPTEGLLDDLGPQGLHDTIFTTVGYGTQMILGGANGGGPPHFDRESRGTRKFVHESFVSLQPAWLRLQMHEDGQTCTGDSGSPSLLSDRRPVAISVAGDAACKNMDSHLRLDTPSARAFLGQFVELP